MAGYSVDKCRLFESTYKAERCIALSSITHTHVCRYMYVQIMHWQRNDNKKLVSISSASRMYKQTILQDSKTVMY